MSASKELMWTDVKATDTLAVLEALQTELSDILLDTELEAGGYFISTPSGISLHDVQDIRKALLPTGERVPQYISLKYRHNRLETSRSLSRVELTIRNFSGISVRVTISGEANNELFGFIETTNNRVTSLIDQRNETGWTCANDQSRLQVGTSASTVSAQPPSPSASRSANEAEVDSTLTLTPDATSPRSGWLRNPDSISRHPIIVAGIGALITIIVGLFVGLTFGLGPFKPSQDATPTPSIPATSSAAPTTQAVLIDPPKTTP
ncbi:hypothetical protein [Rhodococcus sp. 06-1460-1B]|uniref:hypothetical protein n=1 Tax=Rhodococcus sp. 06-1460-1B TaxID=2022501 RepID=UPI0011406D25|nr:hypothetical protein [Rhodococcus sp. 06-1460-1B]